VPDEKYNRPQDLQRSRPAGLERFHKCCSDVPLVLWTAVFLIFAFVSAPSQGFFIPAPSPKPGQKSKILAAHRYIISVNALGFGRFDILFPKQGEAADLAPNYIPGSGRLVLQSFCAGTRDQQNVGIRLRFSGNLERGIE
jgi:hypothetical protein